MCFNVKYFVSAAVAAAVVLTGCVADRVDCPPEQPSGPFMLSLNLMVPSESPATTRAGGHASEAAGSEENYIDIENDLRVLVFDGSDKLIQVIDNMQKQSESSIDGYEIYSLIGPVDPSLDDGSLASFRVMILANWKSFGGSYDSFGTSGAANGGISISAGSGSIFKNASDFNFTSPNKTSAPWRPSGSGAGIPMFGLSDKLDVSLGDKDGTNVTVHATIPMLRAVAKVEIVDKLPTGTITGVSLSRSNANGRFIPDIENDDNKEWNKPEIQIKSPSLPSPVEDLTGLRFFSEQRTIDGQSRTVWVAYIPEMLLSSADTGKSRPVFNIEVDNLQTFTPAFDNYYNNAVNEADKLKSVLRNHIYRYTVEGINISAMLTLEVLPWNMVYDKNVWDFDTPKVKPSEGDYSYYLTWTTKEEVDGEMRSNGYVDRGKPSDDGDGSDENLRPELLMKQGTDDYAEGTFTLSAPMNARWYASLVPLGDSKLDAFKFVKGKDEDGRLIDGGDEGVIKGETITIRIANTAERVADVRNEAKLVIMVELPDHTQREVVVVRPDLQTVDTNYTIVQEITAIM